MLPFCNHFAILHKNIYYFFRENSKIICNKKSLPLLYPLSPLRQSAYIYIKSGGWCGGFAREQPYLALFCRFFDKNVVGQAYISHRFCNIFPFSFIFRRNLQHICHILTKYCNLTVREYHTSKYCKMPQI